MDMVTKMRLRQLLSTRRNVSISLAAILLAGLSAGAALGSAVEYRAPQLTMLLSFYDGFARARLGEKALSSVLSAQEPGAQELNSHLKIPTTVQEQVRRLSRESLREEPLNPIAVRNLALAEIVQSSDQQTLDLFAASRALSRRDSTTNIWFVKHYINTNQERPALNAFDTAMRASSQTRDLFIGQLALALQSPDFAAPLATILQERKSNWEAQFWTESYRHPEFAAGFGELRKLRAADGFNAPERADQNLLNMLLLKREYLIAEEVFDAIKGSAPKTAERVRNAEFSDKPFLPPFDWIIEPNSLLVSQVLPEANLLRVSLYSDASGSVAQQMINLGGSHNFQLNVKGNLNFDEDSPKFFVALTCANPSISTESLRQIPLLSSNTTLTFRLPNSDCEYYWLRLLTRKESGQPDTSVDFTRISIQEVSGSGG